MSIAISLIIPVYNQKQTIQIVMRSIKDQSKIKKEDYEIVLVNDGGGNEYGEILREYSDYNIQMVCHKNNLGRSAARNSGAKIAHGEILIFNDGDRFLSPKFIWSHYLGHKNKNHRVVIGDIAEVFERKYETYLEALPNMFKDPENKIWRCVRRYNYAEQVLKIYDERGATNSLIPWITLFSGNFSIRKGDFILSGGFDESFKEWGYENIEFGHRLYLQGLHYKYMKEAVNFHIYHQQNRGRNAPNLISQVMGQKLKHDVWEQYIGFLNGCVPLEEIVSETYNRYESGTYFVKNKVGSRYIWKN